MWGWWIGLILCVKADKMKKECQGSISHIVHQASGDGVTFSFNITDNNSALIVRVTPGTAKLSEAEATKQMSQAPPANMMQAYAPPNQHVMTVPVAPQDGQGGIPVAPIGQMPHGITIAPPAKVTTKARSVPKKTEGETEELANKFIPPNRLDDIQPCIMELKRFEEKLDDRVATTAVEEKQIREVFEQIRSILQAEATKAMENPDYINATFMKFHGRHSDAYDVGHNKGSGADPNHESTVKLAVQLKEKAEEENPKVQQSTLSPIVLVKQAIELKDYYNTLVTGLAEASGGTLILPPARQLKCLYRIIEKSAMRTGEMKNMCNNVFDVLRCMVLFSDDASIGEAMTYLAEHAEIVRVKERLANSSRTSEGWGDIMVNFRLRMSPEKEISAGTQDHVCEVQFARKQMYDMRSSLGGHEEYVWFRAAEELHLVNAMDLPTTKLSIAISNRISQFQAQRRFSQCAQLQDLSKRVAAIEGELDAIKKQISISMEDGDFTACAKLQEKEDYFEQQLKLLHNEFDSVAT